MKISFHKIASYTALILVSALPLSEDAFAQAEKKLTILEVADVEPDVLKHHLLKQKHTK